MPVTVSDLATHARDALRRHGYVLIPDFLSPPEVAAARENMQRYYPTSEEFSAAAPPRYRWLTENLVSGIVSFPFVDDALNDLATSDAVIDLARELIGVRDVRMVGSGTWAKYAGNFDYEQDLHLDFPNNTLVVPREDDRFRKLEFFIYLSDIDHESGPTHVLSREHLRDVPIDEPFLDRTRYSELYELETAAVGSPGTVLIYTLDTYHRGSAFSSPSGYRWLLGASYRAAGVDWIGRAAWPFYGGGPEMNRFLTRASVDQRSVIGFPQPGDPYWNDDTLQRVARRYPGIDLSAYERASLPQ